MDVVLLAVIVAFFAGAALLVRVIDRMIVGAGQDAGADEEPEPGRRR